MSVRSPRVRAGSPREHLAWGAVKGRQPGSPSLTVGLLTLYPPLSLQVLTLVKQMVYRCGGPIREIVRNNIGAGLAQRIFADRSGNAKGPHAGRAA